MKNLIISVIQKICGRIGHQMVDNKWAYEGGLNAITWCHKCGAEYEVPKEVIMFKFKDSRSFMKMLNTGFLKN